MYAVKQTQIDRREILRHLPEDGIDTVALSMYLGGYSVPELRSALTEMAEEGQIEALKDDRWKPKEARLTLVPEPGSRLEQLEKEIESIGNEIRLGFYQIGIRLQEINESLLYQEKGFLSFEEYVKQVFGFGANYAYKTIAAANCYEDILPFCTLGTKTELSEKILRPIASKVFGAEARKEIWQEIEAELDLEEQSGKKPKLTSKKVKNAALAYQERQIVNPPKLPDLEVGDIVLVKLGSEHLDKLRKYQNQLVRVTKVSDFGRRQCVACQSLWGEPITEHFYREELREVSEDYRHKEVVDIPLKTLLKMTRVATSLSSAISIAAQFIED